MLIQWDRNLLLLLNGSDSVYIDGIMWTVTQTSTWIPMALVLVFVLSRSGNWRSFLLALVFIALVILCCDQFASSFCKPFFHRFRPTHDPQIGALVDVVNGYRGGRYGFISSHAANTFGVTVFLSLLFRRRVIASALLFWALACSYSRLYLGVHFPLDILSGALFGTLAGSVLYSLFQTVCKRYPEHFASPCMLCPRWSVMAFSLSFLLTWAYVGIRAFFFSPAS